MKNLYGETDPRDIPIYSISDAAKYLRIPVGTIRSWTVSISNGSNFSKPLILTQDIKPKLLSFTNLVEIHVLRAIRKHHQMQRDKVRIALDYIEEKFQVLHPLASEKFSINGVDLLIERYASLLNVSEDWRIDLKSSFNTHFQRIEFDKNGFAMKLFPFTASQEENNPRIVVIDPRIAFGRLVIAETGIPTIVLAQRLKAGESIQDLAYDYKCDRLKIEEAIRCELPAA
ncbi:DUF433 domain-containing protein [Dolichospermum circinale]|uniref:DUF433 domain-containing protein n=1 Tax=Dolichospermum circinale CS-537/01 TaxID=3021739 RepID=A0ABT5A4W0_9CYAN|nr:DUF433 domain-containing protein [Dolichospermum circinale]MDB9460268.1 DUF433 domain-containing protein [Dolichospermum circinale CS-545/17]MDB9465227.1 DUF433 domain-containing protein [Dolichospermum circinale CS-539/09]MDB9471366.1 DUF433 domain-containing protein [Dolichospermum circinale CS-539]MDB9486982.1 DUF433 domain-containing protein [Dolichospermum circinale CS-537/01]